ncbi:phytoene desaturase [Candidatus Uabimicrobium amorphum]|uniref:Phytoene dehydrogenase n=1 Tax=Uabimicrobium amorphum TaxID=2596890 RepID=A0A5S9INU0_UABAM|nr:phytoene desaturase [Candidatus Uabimicrobium amorphum]BBM85309.1 phytoene desaturase [Candidatus Uabimicrobium amorphum]
MKKAIVIGSGFGGLAAAIRLQASGFQTSIFEKRDIAGGRAYVYRDNGFIFDAGPTVITAPHCLEELFAIAGKKMEDYVELLDVDPMYRLLWEDGFVFDYTNDEKRLMEQIRRKSPKDVDNYKRFLEYTHQVFEEGYIKLADVPFLNWWSMIRVTPQLTRLQSFKSTYRRVSDFIQDPHLRQAFSFSALLVGGNPYTTSCIYTLIHYIERKWGVYFAKGGTNQLVQGLVRLFEDIGGKIYYNKEIHEIKTINGKVDGILTKDGETAHCDFVVSNAEIMHTYRDLLNKEKRVNRVRNKLEKSRFSMSLFVLYLGLDRQWPNLVHHNVMFGSRFKGLLEDIFYGNKLPDDFSLYVHAPSNTDKSLAPQGGEALYALSPVPHLGNANIDWEKMASKYADRIIDYMEERYMPGLRKSIQTQRVFTPNDFKNILNSHLGSVFSLEPTLTQSAYFRGHNRDPHIDGLYLAGAGTHPGAGMPGVINSAKATVEVILQDAHSLKVG